MAVVSMSDAELARVGVLGDVATGRLSVDQAAGLMGSWACPAAADTPDRLKGLGGVDGGEWQKAPDLPGGVQAGGGGAGTDRRAVSSWRQPRAALQVRPTTLNVTLPDEAASGRAAIGALRG